MGPKRKHSPTPLKGDLDRLPLINNDSIISWIFQLPDNRLCAFETFIRGAGSINESRTSLVAFRGQDVFNLKWLLLRSPTKAWLMDPKTIEHDNSGDPFWEIFRFRSIKVLVSNIKGAAFQSVWIPPLPSSPNRHSYPNFQANGHSLACLTRF